MSEQVLRILRQVKFDLPENDRSRDEELKRLDPEVALRLCCQWELGDPGWAFTFKNWAEGCGFEVKAKKASAR